MTRIYIYVDLFLDIVSQYDAKDPTNVTPDLREQAQKSCFHHVKASIPDWRGTESLKGLRVGVPQVGRHMPSSKPSYIPLTLSFNCAGILSKRT